MDDLTQSVVLERLAEAFADASLNLDSKLEPDLALEQIEGLDSVSRVRLMLSIEEVFGVEVTPKENSGFRTVADLVAFIIGKGAGSR